MGHPINWKRTNARLQRELRVGKGRPKPGTHQDGRSKRRALSKAQVERGKFLVTRLGWSYAQVARHFETSPATVMRWCPKEKKGER